MNRKLIRVIATLVFWALVLAGSVTARQKRTTNVPIDGIIESFDFQHVDDLLELERIPTLRMIVFKTSGNEEVSSVHLEKFKAWVSSGGLAYFAAPSLPGALFKKLQFPVDVAKLTFFKESREEISSSVGELFVKAALPNIVIHDHAITQGVKSLYVTSDTTGWYYFRYQPPAIPPLFALFVSNAHDKGDNSLWGPLRFKPILQVATPGFPDSGALSQVGNEFGYAHIGGNMPGQYVIYAVIERDKGLFILDGTGLGVGGGRFNGNSYDWPAMYKNILQYRSSGTEESRRPPRDVPSQFSFAAISRNKDKKGHLKEPATAGTLSLSHSQLNWNAESGSGFALEFRDIYAVEAIRPDFVSGITGVTIFLTKEAAKRLRLRTRLIRNAKHAVRV